jgi:hypothetical protein
MFFHPDGLISQASTGIKNRRLWRLRMYFNSKQHYLIYCHMANTEQLHLPFAICKALSVSLMKSSVDNASPEACSAQAVRTFAISFIQVSPVW